MLVHRPCPHLPTTLPSHRPGDLGGGGGVIPGVRPVANAWTFLCLSKSVEGWNPLLTENLLETRSEPWLRKGREGSQSKTGNRKLLKSSFKGISVSSSLLRLYFLQGCFCLLWPHSPPPPHLLFKKQFVYKSGRRVFKLFFEV